MRLCTSCNVPVCLVLLSVAFWEETPGFLAHLVETANDLSVPCQRFLRDSPWAVSELYRALAAGPRPCVEHRVCGR